MADYHWAQYAAEVYFPFAVDIAHENDIHKGLKQHNSQQDADWRKIALSPLLPACTANAASIKPAVAKIVSVGQAALISR
jgi:hypothetical protein